MTGSHDNEASSLISPHSQAGLKPVLKPCLRCRYVAKLDPDFVRAACTTGLSSTEPRERFASASRLRFLMRWITRSCRPSPYRGAHHGDSGAALHRSRVQDFRHPLLGRLRQSEIERIAFQMLSLVCGESRLNEQTAHPAIALGGPLIFGEHGSRDADGMAQLASMYRFFVHPRFCQFCEVDPPWIVVSPPQERSWIDVTFPQSHECSFV